MTILYDLRNIDFEVIGWKRKALQMFHKKMTDQDSKFPCIPAYQGYILHHFLYGFASDPRTRDAAKDMAKLLKEYGIRSKKMGDYTALVIFFDTPENVRETFSVNNYEVIFWNLLNQVSQLDTSEWPNHIVNDPSHYSWEYCFESEQYFVYCATPAHVKRKSRSFPYFMLAITPRWVLQKFFSCREQSQKVQKTIRERVHAYDSMQPHPDLKWYGQKDNLEWKQYFLRDDNTTLPVCPFRVKKE